ncbi:MAG TPA: hypothetical protein P5111_11470, partial [Kiritimatiellia bacterium]|nr:hypothetical protein [Kiritimatiellia bacterium]
MKRREFIKNAAAGIGGLSVLGARGQDAAAAKKPLRIAVIGCGDRGVRTLLTESCKERVVALADPDPQRIAAALEQVRKTNPSADIGAIKTFSDYRPLFDVMG